jgi:hypothetical protein
MSLNELQGTDQPAAKKEKQRQVIIKLEWIFGIRNDLTPNIYLLDKDTLIYPAGNYVVVFNYPRNLGANNIQHYIPGSPHSKGIVAIATSNFSQRLVAIAEETFTSAVISFYNITGRQGYKNFPDKQNTFELDDDIRITRLYSLAFSNRRKNVNYVLALGSNDTSYYFIVFKWDLEAIRDKPEIIPAKLPKEVNVHSNKKFHISFSTASMENSDFIVVSDDFVGFYTIGQKGITLTEEIDVLDQDEDYGNEIFSHCWLYEGNFCFVTDKYINIFDGKFKTLQQQIENEDAMYRVISPYTLSSSFEGFVVSGVEKKMVFYGKRTGDTETENNLITNPPMNDDNILPSSGNINNNHNHHLGTASNQKNELFEYLYEKTKFEFQQGLNEKITADKLPQNDKVNSNDRMFDFHSMVTFFDEEFIIATTSNNDLIYINTKQKDIDTQLVSHLIAPFHCDSIEGMDVCINKPYIITCSKDKSVRLWDYQNRIHVISKIFEEELYSITYHPSGMHALVSTDDKIYPLNVFYDEIDNMTQPITTKAKSKDIKFSNMGHLFAFDSGTFVQIWDFMNMQLFTGPPPYGPQKKSFSTTTSKINFLSWNEDDKNLLACGNEYIYDWKVKEDHDTKPKLPQSNITSVVYYPYINNTNVYLATTEDMQLRRLVGNANNYISDKFDYSMKELTAMRNARIILCATTKYGKPLVDNSGNSNSSNSNVNINSNTNALNSGNALLNSNSTFTTCLRVFPDISKSNHYIDIPSHHGETLRIRFNFEENRIFTCGEDGCINVYSLEFPLESEPDRYISDQNYTFTNTVLIKKTRYKERDFDKKELPVKRDEKLKKIKSENNDKRETDKKQLEEMKNKIAGTKYTENNIVNKMKMDLQNTEVEYNTKIKKVKQDNDNEHDAQFNENQIQLSIKTREVEAIRDQIKQHKDKHKTDVEEIRKQAEARRNHSEAEFNEKRDKLNTMKNDLIGKIKNSQEDQVEDGKALSWLNERVVSEIKSNIDELSHKIDELRVHYTHHIKKQKEEKEKLQQIGDNLNFELKKIGEEKERQARNKKRNHENKKKAEDEMEKMTKRISEIENKIIECKKAHTYLEKCKFVLSYKIQELKKEAGPMEKVLEDLQKRTKEDELSLAKYNREFDIISQKLVDLEDLKQKTKAHERTERDLKNEINSFKIDLFNMLAFIDDYDKLREGFRNLREKYLKNYVPEVQDHELEGEFNNQKSKMKNRVFELQETLSTLKEKHRSNIAVNRHENTKMIEKIANLKNLIRLEKKTKAMLSSDQKHANAVAEIYAGQAVKKLMLKDISIQDKIQLFKNTIKTKKEMLKNIRIEAMNNPNFANLEYIPNSNNNNNGIIDEDDEGVHSGNDNNNDGGNVNEMYDEQMEELN